MAESRAELVARVTEEMRKRNAALTAEVERLTEERDGWKATADLFEKTAKEAARGLECLNEIDEAWDAFGTKGNRTILTLAEQISSLDRELDEARAELAKRAEPVAKYCTCANSITNPCIVCGKPKFIDPAWLKQKLENDPDEGEIGAGFELFTAPPTSAPGAVPQRVDGDDDRPRHYDSQGYCDNPGRGY